MDRRNHLDVGLPTDWTRGAICYSGYRQGQSPAAGIYPSYSEILQDLHILQNDWQLLRVYDAGPHAQTVLEVIRRERLDFKVMLGIDLAAEQNNPNCPWGAVYPDHKIESNKQHNEFEIERVLRLANEYAELVMAVSIGNEASVDWTDHLVSDERLVQIAKQIKDNCHAPVTFCENYIPWASGQLDSLAEVVDIISLHTYPLWESKPIEEALNYTIDNYQQVAHRFPGKPVIITEAGWATAANGRGFPPNHANEAWQVEYCRRLLEWSREHQILTFVFEAFDEAWKGSPDPYEPEKHWGLYNLERRPKPVVNALRELLI